MAVLLGIDIGTSSAKVMLAESNGKVIGISKKNYDIAIPQTGYAEQDPQIWWEAVKENIQSLGKNYPEDFKRIAAIGFSGQMHGLVPLDKHNNPLRPAVIWLDQRSEKQVAQIEEKLLLLQNKKVLQNPIHSGFPLPSLLWIKAHENDVYQKINSVVFPKDFIRLKITGQLACERSDASASLYFNVEKREWAWDVIRLFSLRESMFPQLKESTDLAGYTTTECEQETGLRVGIPVVCGSGDQMAQSIGNGIIEEGILASNIGSGGQISAYVKSNMFDAKLRLHSFCHAVNHAYTVYGATLCAGMSMNWMKNKILGINDYNKISTMAGEIAAGSEGVVFLPYLSGERTPYMAPYAKGMFYGLALGHDNRHLLRAVMEGVVFSLKDSLCLMEELGIVCNKIIASGGGALDNVWLQIQADILGKEIFINRIGEQACLGACMLAGIGTGIFAHAQDACERMVVFQDVVYLPNKETAQVYAKNYSVYKELYGNNKVLMATVHNL